MYLEKTAVETRKKENMNYTTDEAFNEALKYFNGDELAARVWVNKYALKKNPKEILELSPDEMHKRLASELFRIEQKYKNPVSEQEIYEVLKDFKYIVPQGGPMTGIGNDYQIASLSNCFVIGNQGPSDSYGGILKIDQEQVQLMKRRGGVGHDLSHIRPDDSHVMNSALTSTGIVPFMERYSNSTREVAQDGRRGALMLSVSIKHPDSEAFIDAKLNTQKVTEANVSVKIDNAFMEAVKSGNKYIQQFPVDSNTPDVTKEIDAKNLWGKIVHNAWKSAEPGILFWDTIINESIPDCYADLGYETVSTNPCGEIPLCPYDSCRLLAINLFSYVEDPFSEEAKFDFEKFKKHAAIAQRLMDDIVDLESEKIDAILRKIDNDPETDDIKEIERRLWENIKVKTLQGRRTGIGITAEGDMLASLGLKYGSEDAIDFSEQVHKSLAIEVYRSSVKLAKERGAFTIYSTNREKNNPFIQRIKESEPELYKDMTQHGRRNIALLTIAPTGTTSLMTQTTSGIEPVYLPVHTRRRKINPADQDAKTSFVDSKGDHWEEYKVFHHKFVDWLKIKNYNIEEVLKYDDQKLKEIINKSPYHQATSNDINWVDKVKMQGRIQQWVDHSISATVNIPANATTELVDKVYQTAWESGCKGITIYRDGSREGILVSNDKSKKSNNSKSFTKRPQSLEAEIIRFRNENEEWIAFVGLKDGKPYEIFTGISDEDNLVLPKSIKNGEIVKIKNAMKGKSRYDFKYVDKNGYPGLIGGLQHMFKKEYWNYAKLISGVLRNGMPIEHVVNLVASLELDENINTWKRGVERALRGYIPNGVKVHTGEHCENCGETSLVYQEGCLICTTCGSSKCG